ncbi:hypothetical protein PhCBS80983_g05099 [Powellomyces hirtus]|uniref:Peptidase A1 domain-containing protein n=1 Tax=Powellomyces hirtus TaxID=109895 RepID=A0A507DVH9_9FUNG|nr:hypothetical protein PhCBS80983_g05099 [Powellomyces hirtus]
MGHVGDFQFDTGSYQLWVRSTKCTAALCTGLKSYDGSKSSTYVSTTTPAPKVTYADGTKVSGVYAFDTVGIAGLKVARLPFMEVTETNDPHGTVFDGIMGMCWPPVNAPKTYFLSLVDNGGFNSPAMGYYLNKGATAGAVTMGGVDTARFTGQLTWVPSFGYAADGSGAGPFIFFQGLTIGAAYTNDTGTTNIPWTQPQDNFLAVFDTGTSYGIVPTRVAAALHANIPGITSRKTASGTMWSVACSEANFGTFGDMSLKFVGMGGEIVTLTVEPAVYFVVYSKKGGGYTCESTIVGNDDIQTPVVQNGPVIGAILGNAFLQKFYTVFDWSTNRTGFATAVREQNVTPNLVALNTSTTGTGSNASTNVFRNYWPATPTSDGESTILSNIGGYALKGAPSIANLASTLTSIWMLFA